MGRLLMDLLPAPLPVDRRWRTFKSAGKRRDASEMISRQRVTVYMAR
jgi:hypothetical protein